MRNQHRSIIERWVITGKLILESPAHFGNGEADALNDMPILFDEVDGKPLLPGTSIAGALRNYLREREFGYGIKEEENSPASLLFGGFRGDDEGAQSPLIVYDAIGKSAGLELRDGVAIDSIQRTAIDEKKFDIQLLAAGSAFDLRFELLVNEKEKNSQELRDALVTALSGLQDRQITLGARKGRGFGQCTCSNWEVQKYDLKDKEQLKKWLVSERNWADMPGINPQSGQTLGEMLDAKILEKDIREEAVLTATFSIDGTLLIRSGFGSSDDGPDTVHLHSKRSGSEEPVPVIPGTSWAGVLRHRALKIARTVSKNNKENKEKSQSFIDNMFGPSEIKKNDKDTRASRVRIQESQVYGSTPMVMTRVKIDRFTGSAFESALFGEQPEIGKLGDKNVRLDLILHNPTEAETGLLLLLLKDLWTGDLPIGGESSVGRGRLKGINATLDAMGNEWNFNAEKNNGLTITPESKKLQDFVTAFKDEMVGA
jgi:CRISPR/Cas system CSM-associated protein Csm3 (group 7 of RAMP superfamily)